MAGNFAHVFTDKVPALLARKSRGPPPEAITVHHITDEMVKGKRFDDTAVAQLLEGVSLVIAHNAKFDRPFLETRFPLFIKTPWACSIRDVAWRDAGYPVNAGKQS